MGDCGENEDSGGACSEDEESEDEASESDCSEDEASESDCSVDEDSGSDCSENEASESDCSEDEEDSDFLRAINLNFTTNSHKQCSELFRNLPHLIRTTTEFTPATCNTESIAIDMQNLT